MTEGENQMTQGKEQELRLSCCPLCGGEIQATVDRYYSLRGGVWVESGLDGETRLYCENDCDLSEYSKQVPEIG